MVLGVVVRSASEPTCPSKACSSNSVIGYLALRSWLAIVERDPASKQRSTLPDASRGTVFACGSRAKSHLAA